MQQSGCLCAQARVSRHGLHVLGAMWLCMCGTAHVYNVAIHAWLSVQMEAFSHGCGSGRAHGVAQHACCIPCSL
eukprot:364875-Chlamydomonas_euryale.AAC.5